MPATAYLPLSTYPEAPSDDAVLAAVGFAGLVADALHVTSFSVSIPHVSSPFGDLLVDVPGLIQTTEVKSKAECVRLQGLVQKAVAGKSLKLEFENRKVVLGGMLDAAALEARTYECVILPWWANSLSARELAEAVVFGSSRPTILIPPVAIPSKLDHIAIAWDESRVAARALWDALALLPENGRATVLTIRDDKPLRVPDLANSLASTLIKQGYNVDHRDIALGARSVSDALQSSALEAGAQLLAMGGFGHSRLRDFVLGGATKDVLENLRMPVLLSH